jgi:hypothetical protein
MPSSNDEEAPFDIPVEVNPPGIQENNLKENKALFSLDQH